MVHTHDMHEIKNKGVSPLYTVDFSYFVLQI